MVVSHFRTGCLLLPLQVQVERIKHLQKGWYCSLFHVMLYTFWKAFPHIWCYHVQDSNVVGLHVQKFPF